MRLLRICAAALALVAAASAQNPTGRWEARWSPVDEARKMILALNVEGGKVTGYVAQPGGSPVPIVEGTVNGSELTLVVERPGRGGAGAGRGAPVRTTYTASLKGDKLILTMPPGRGGASQTREFTRVSTEAPKPLPPPAPRVALPAPKPVPYNGLAKTPPMGWNSWNKFAERVTDKDVRDMADAFVSSGMKAAGYIYVNIDDTWELGRDAKGNITSNSKFPNMKALADYVHSKGLKLGIYSSPGPTTCAGYEGSYQHEVQDAKQYAAWGIDYLKYDWCSAGNVYENDSMKAAYALMGEALLKSGRKIVYSLCQYGQQNVGEWGASVGGNLWRTTGDISDRWQSMSNLGFSQQLERAKFAGPGHWNDPDMLEIGNGGMTDVEYQTHMSLWSLLAAPLLAGNDLRTMTPAIHDILTNKEVIAVDQDKLGTQGVRISPPGTAANTGNLEVWARPLADGGRAVGLFNKGADSAKATVKLSDLGMQGSHKARDLWKHTDLSPVAGEYSAEVPSHGVVMIKVAK
jgi:alpha-galactosidase